VSIKLERREYIFLNRVKMSNSNIVVFTFKVVNNTIANVDFCFLNNFSWHVSRVLDTSSSIVSITLSYEDKKNPRGGVSSWWHADLSPYDNKCIINGPKVIILNFHLIATYDVLSSLTFLIKR
jgi:hypothetical protein